MDSLSVACCRTRIMVLMLVLMVSAVAIRLALEDRLASPPRGPLVVSPPDFTIADRCGWIEVVLFPPVIARASGGALAAPAGGDRPADPLPTDGVIPLGALLEMRVGAGDWGPPHAEGIAADGMVVVNQRPVLVHIPTTMPWMRHAFRARTLIAAAGPPRGGVISGLRPTAGPAEAPPGRILSARAITPDAAATQAGELRYRSEYSGEQVLLATGNVRFALVRVIGAVEDAQKSGAVFEVSAALRTIGEEHWLTPPIQYTLRTTGDPLDFMAIVRSPLDEGPSKMQLRFQTPFSLKEVTTEVKRIAYYEITAKPRAAGGGGRDLAVREKSLQTQAVELAYPTGEVITLPTLMRIARPPHPGAIIYPDFPSPVYDELAEFRKDPAAFRQWGLIPSAPVEHQPGSGPLEEQRNRTGDPQLATDTRYYELADGRLVYWEPVNMALRVYRLPDAHAEFRAALPEEPRPPALSRAATPEVVRPFWAAAAGSDAVGPWADLVLRDARQRLRWIPPGSFIMGSPAGETGREAQEVPHEVTLSSGFWLMDGPCTQALWQEVMAANPSRFADDPQGPVEGVSFEDVQDFRDKLNDRMHGEAFSLPSEAQFEYACRAGEDGPFGESTLDASGWHAGNSAGRTHPVRGKQANRWGLYDLHGNVWEWCADWMARYPTEAVSDPGGPDEAGQKVIRGGSWMSGAERCRAGCRSALEPIGMRTSTLGFRLLAPALVPGASPRVRHFQSFFNPAAHIPTPVPATHLDQAEWAAASGDDRYGHWAELAVKGVRQRLRWIHRGWFTMGSPPDEEGRSADEGQHAVQIGNGFWMADSACTQELWQAVMGAAPAHVTGDLQRPVEAVSWWEVQRFLDALQSVVAAGRIGLPSEAQREYACRAGSGGPFAGPALEGIAWFGGNSGGATHAVKQRAPNAWGLHDLQGNVWEWCSDWYGPYPALGGADEVSDPQGPADGTYKVVRGGSWAHGARFCRAAHRDYLEPGGSNNQVGFRFCILDYWR